MQTSQIIRELEAAAKNAGRSVDDLCRQIGINRVTWQRWKGGQSEPHLKHYRALLSLKEDLGAAPSRKSEVA